MLSKSPTLRARQQGVTLMISLVVLVIMTLAGIALMRSVDTTNIIAGNLAFQQSAMHSGDSGIETAIDWLETNNAGGYLYEDRNGVAECFGYNASLVDGPAAGVSWDAWWNSLGACQTVTLATDVAGNTASFTIQRMCQATGDPNSTPSPGCATSSITTVGGTTSSQTSGYVALQYSGQVYYRITSRILGPRGTKSYVQSIVAM